MATTVIVGIDTGGTFTDLVAIAGGRLLVHKVLSTPDDPARAVIAGLKAMLEGDPRPETRGAAPRSGHLQLDRGDQRAARAQGRARPAADQCRLRGRGRDRTPEPQRPLFARSRAPGTAGRARDAPGRRRANLLRRQGGACALPPPNSIAYAALPLHAAPTRSPSACSTPTPTRQASSGLRARSRRWACRFRSRIASSPSTASSSGSRPRWSTRTWHRGCPRTSAGWSAICARRACA